ncbi:uncharacterized protein TM35_000281730 [Trypanosoma theileri]|uniref:Uncharacterized protein n=1 Tax=Trypanosoma theileri TaxID=67003 RepID=A0A1X0NP36_9TRYP|nr:uncharacterized protein TM35_000281730 [Trypanosoma theileri]ORC86457.1 hypothetical protein TM35_000281730 [Trypanosoma theileri]
MLHSEETSAATAVTSLKRKRILSAEEIHAAEVYYQLSLQYQWQLFQSLSTLQSNNNNNDSDNQAEQAKLTLGRWINTMLASHLPQEPQGNKENQQYKEKYSYGDDLRELFLRLQHQQQSFADNNNTYGKRGRNVEVLQYYMPNIWSLLI